MAAMDRETGREIDGLEEIEQAIDEILSTTPGDRIMRADYGADLFSLVDIGMDAAGQTRIARVIGDAIRKFEPRVQIDQVQTDGGPGELRQTVIGKIRATSEQIAIRR